MRKNAAFGLMIAAALSLNASASECVDRAAYEQGLCLYSRGDFARALAQFDEAIASSRTGPQKPKAMYFRGRSLMKLERWKEAGQVWIELFSVSPSFYRLWNCDYLLGVCRARGRNG